MVLHVTLQNGQNPVLPGQAKQIQIPMDGKLSTHILLLFWREITLAFA